MALEINRLSARKVQALSEPGGSKRWVLLYRMPGRRREMGLGSANIISLARARELAAAARAQIAEGIDPIEARTAAVAPPPPPAPVTLADVAETYMADRERTWRNAAHHAQWRQTLVQAANL